MLSRRILLVTAYISILTLLGVVATISHEEPIEWIQFTQAEKDAQLANGHIVLMFGKPRYHSGAKTAARSFENEKLKTYFKSGQIVPMLLEYDDWEGEEIRMLFQKHGHTKHPISLLYVPNHEPIKLDPFSPSDILNHIRENLK